MSTARSDWNMLRPVVQGASQCPGLTVEVVRFKEGPLSTWSDKPADIVGVAIQRMLGYSARLCAEQKDLVLIAGDRYEAVVAAFVAAVHQVPVAHIHGGDETVGSYDNMFRHCITKLSHLHFVATELAKERVIALGEDPKRVFRTGNPALDDLMTWADGEELQRDSHVLVVFHPETLAADFGVATAKALGKALANLGDPIVGVSPTRDVGGYRVRRALVDEVVGKVESTWWDSLLPEKFRKEMATCSVMVGNSSAGLIEAPLFGTPVVNVGDRQEGRLHGGNVVEVRPGAHWKEIRSAIVRARSTDFRLAIERESPYGDGKAVARILEVLAGIPDPRALLKKPWGGRDEGH